MLGILGGMGPLAGADMLKKITLLTEAERDQDHFRIISYSDPTIPDRSAAIMNEAMPSPLPGLKKGLQFLERSGATFAVMACNSAHHWYDCLSNSVGIPILHIADAVVEDLELQGAVKGETVGVLGTEGTIRSGFYDEVLLKNGYKSIALTTEEMRRFLVPAIASVKSGKPENGKENILSAIDLMRKNGANWIILACTELPLAVDMDLPKLVNANLSLAKKCVKHASCKHNDNL